MPKPSPRARGRRRCLSRLAWARLERPQAAVRAADYPSVSSRVSVVACVHNQVEYTRRCLETFLAERSPLLAQIVVVDNGSTDGTADYLAGLGDPLVEVVSPGQNLGFVG